MCWVPLPFTCHVTHVTGHVSGSTWHVSLVSRHTCLLTVMHVPVQYQHPVQPELCHRVPATCHMSVTCNCHVWRVSTWRPRPRCWWYRSRRWSCARRGVRGAAPPPSPPPPGRSARCPRTAAGRPPPAWRSAPCRGSGRCCPAWWRRGARSGRCSDKCIDSRA